MKLLTELDQIICDFKDRPISVTEEIERCPKCGYQSQAESSWTIADVLLNIISQSAMQGKDQYVLYDVGKAIHAAEDGRVKLEDHPFDLLKKEVDGFAKYTLAVMAPVRLCLEKCAVGEYVDRELAPTNDRK